MQALRFHAARDLRIEDVPEPSAPGPGEVLVRTAACGICGTDLHEYVAGPIVTLLIALACIALGSLAGNTHAVLRTSRFENAPTNEVTAVLGLGDNWDLKIGISGLARWSMAGSLRTCRRFFSSIGRLSSQ